MSDYISVDEAAGVVKTPYEMIQEAATLFGVEVKQPKKNCKHCFGRGYTGLNAKDKSPIACTCIYPDMNAETKVAWQNRDFIPRNRKEKRSI
jgi:ferredoxin-thioredoxin reductase catalytic subunit